MVAPAGQMKPITHRRMDHSRAPLLEALADYHRLDRYGFTPPANRQGRGIDPRVPEVMGLDPFHHPTQWPTRG